MVHRHSCTQSLITTFLQHKKLIAGQHNTWCNRATQKHLVLFYPPVTPGVTFYSSDSLVASALKQCAGTWHD